MRELIDRETTKYEQQCMILWLYLIDPLNFHRSHNPIQYNLVIINITQETRPAVGLNLLKKCVCQLFY